MIDALAARSGVIVPDVVDAATAAAVRARLVTKRYTLVDRGSYEIGNAPIALLSRIAPHVTGALVDACVVRLRAGDYILARHDVSADDGMEIILDLSATSTPGAEVHYRQHGQVMFRVPNVPGSLAIVPRTASVSCNHVYISKLHANAEVVRLVARFS